MFHIGRNNFIIVLFEIYILVSRFAAVLPCSVVFDNRSYRLEYD